MSKSKKRRLRKKAESQNEKKMESVTYEQLIDNIRHKTCFLDTIKFIQDWSTDRASWKFSVHS